MLEELKETRRQCMGSQMERRNAGQGSTCSKTLLEVSVPAEPPGKPFRGLSRFKKPLDESERE